MDIQQFEDALEAMLQAETGKDWKVGEVPSDNPQSSYGVIHLVPAPLPHGSMGELAEWVEIRAVLNCVGNSRQESLWLQRESSAKLVGPNRVTLQANGENVEWISKISTAPPRDDGQSLWTSGDVFNFRIRLD